MGTILTATTILHSSSVFDVILGSPAELVGRHCTGWCINMSTSVLDAYSNDVASGWNAAPVSDPSNGFYIQLIAVPDWISGTVYFYNYVVWYGGSYWYWNDVMSYADLTPPSLSHPSWVPAGTDLAALSTKWANVFVYPGTYGAASVAYKMNPCPFTYCDTLQMTIDFAYTVGTDSHRYYVYNSDGDVYLTSGVWNGVFEIVNVQNCSDYDVYMFKVPAYAAGTYNADDFVLYGGVYYMCTATTSGSPDTDPGSWTVVENDTPPYDGSAFDPFWARVLDPDYSGNVLLYWNKVAIYCDVARIPYDYALTVDCDYNAAYNMIPQVDVHVYTFAFAYSTPATVLVPDFYDTTTGEFVLIMPTCGEPYDIRSFSIPEYAVNPGAVYLAGTLVWYSGAVYVALADWDRGLPFSFAYPWQYVCGSTYLPSDYSVFEPIASSCYIDTAAMAEKSAMCACVDRYDISASFDVQCPAHTVVFDISTINGEQPYWSAAVFVFGGILGDEFVASFDTSMTNFLTLPNGEYVVYACAVAKWDGYAENVQIVWYNNGFWQATSNTTDAPSEAGPWTAIGITSSDFDSTWAGCGSMPDPTSIAAFNLIVDCVEQKIPLDLSARYGYTCYNSNAEYAFVVSAGCYCVVSMLYSDSAYVDSYYLSGSPTTGTFLISPALADGHYQVETYAIPCWNSGSPSNELYRTGEIVCYNNQLYVANSDNTEEPGTGSAWHLVTAGEIRDTVSTVKDPGYVGQANYTLSDLYVDCTYNTHIYYDMRVEKNCETLSLNVSYAATASNSRCVWASWLFDVTELGMPACDVTYSDIVGCPSVSPYVTSMIIDGDYLGYSPMSYYGLQNNRSYVVVSICVPTYRSGRTYVIGELTYYAGQFWRADYDTFNNPSTAEWTVISPSDISHDQSYCAYWKDYIVTDGDYAIAIGCVDFDCRPIEDASELDISHAAVNSQDASFALIRTNPAITGNINITVDKAGSVWFDSIDANKELAKDQYKHFPVDVTKAHPTNLYSFFNKGQTPADIVFDVHADVNPAVMTGRYEDQFDFSFYYSGVKYMSSKYYDEKFAYFAPLYLKKVLPEYFVIFKIDDPLNMPADQLKNYDYNATDYVYQLLRRASIIKSFDLSERTKIGKYIRNIINDPMFPASPLSVNFDKNGITTWNGASISSGTWNSKGELLSDLYQDDDALKYFEEYVTTGYRRHGIVFPNIVNIEFLFDDETSETFDFNRYIGFYVNAVELERFDVDVERYNSQQQSLGNTPLFFDRVDDCSDNPRVVSNPAGVKLPYEWNSGSLDYRDFGLFREKLFVNYVKDKNHVLHGLAVDNAYEGGFDNGSPQKWVVETLRLSDRSTDISSMFGTDSVFLQDRGFASTNAGLATSYIRIKAPLSNNDVIRVYHDAGSDSDSDGRFDDIIVYSSTASPQYLPVPGSYYAYVNAGSPVIPNIYYVNGNALHGSLDPVLGAVRGCLDYFPSRTFEIIVIKDCIFMRSYASSLANGEYGIRFYSPVAGNYDSVEIGGYSGTDLDGRLVRFSGGTDHVNRLVIDGKHMSKILANMPELLVRTVNGWSRIIGVANYADALDPDTLVNSTAADAAYADYFGKLALTLERDEKPDVSDGSFVIKTAAHPEFGVLSFFNVRDFDCDFYSSKYNRYPEWEYYKELAVPPGMDLLEPDRWYVVKGDTASYIEYNGSTIGYGVSFQAVDGVLSYAIPVNGGSPVVVYVDGSVFQDGNADMSSFDGFMSIRDSRNRTAKFSSDPSDLSEYYSRFAGDIIRSEYDYYRENFTKDFAFKSKILPYISKWGYLNGLDARDNEYRLNNHVFFGEHNFSPSHVHDTQDEAHMTHEWYYMVASYPFIKDRAVAARNYCYFEDDIDLPSMLTVRNEFDRYFTYVPLFDMGSTWAEVGRIQRRYSVIRYNDSTGQCETFFRGAKLAFKDALRDSDGNIVYDPVTKKPAYAMSRRFDGYKFTVLLRPVREDLNDTNQPPIRMRFISHAEYGYVLLLIELAVGYSENIGMLDSPVTFDDPVTGIDMLYSNPANARVDGDYRVSFDGDVSDMTYTFLYGARNKKFHDAKDCFSTIRIPTLFSFGSSGFTSDRSYNMARGSYYNYDSNLLGEMTEYGGQVPITSPYVLAANYFGTTLFNGYPINVTPNSVATTKGFSFSYSVSGGAFNPSADSLSAYKQVAGGRGYYGKFLKKLSFASIVNYINEMGPYKDKLDGFVEYYDYATGSSSPTARDFYAEVIPPSEISKSAAILPDIESNIPDKFRQVREIGFEFKKGQLQNEYTLYRYGGGYEPVFRDVFVFASRYDFAYNPRLLSIFIANNVFATEVDGFGVLRNFCHMKVSDKTILALQDDPKFYPAYELLNEITIGRADFRALHSSWDFGFHKHYVANDQYFDVPGSLRVGEDYTYFSKVLNLPFDTALLDYVKPYPPMEYDSKIEYDPVMVDDISVVDVEKYCLVYSKVSKSTGLTGRTGANEEWVGYINLRNAMIHKFKHGGVSAKFDEFLTPADATTIREYTGFTNVDDYVTAYLTENVYDLYSVYDTYFYMKAEHDDIDFFGVSYNDDSVLANSDWSVIKDVEINKYSRHVLSFKFIKPLNSGATLSPAIKIRLT